MLMQSFEIAKVLFADAEEIFAELRFKSGIIENLALCQKEICDKSR
jgi:hypothetical protein